MAYIQWPGGIIYAPLDANSRLQRVMALTPKLDSPCRADVARRARLTFGLALD